MLRSPVAIGHWAMFGCTTFGTLRFNGGSSESANSYGSSTNHACLPYAAIAISVATGTLAADKNRIVQSPADNSLKSAIDVQSVALRLLEEAEVPAQEAGVITSVAVREGQRVKQGELLTQIDDQVAKLAAEATKAKYDIAKAKAYERRPPAFRSKIDRGLCRPNCGGARNRSSGLPKVFRSRSWMWKNLPFKRTGLKASRRHRNNRLPCWK